MTGWTQQTRIARIDPRREREELRATGARCAPLLLSEMAPPEAALRAEWLVDQLIGLQPGDVLLALRETDGPIRGLISLQPLPWDSDIYGMQMGKLGWFITEPCCTHEWEVKRKLVRAALEQAAEMGYRHLSARLHAEDHSGRHALEDCGFRVMDVQVTLERSVKEQQCPKPVWKAIDDVQPEDLEVLKAMSATAYLRSRLFVDPHLPRSATERLHQQWVENDCRGRADKVLVARLEGRPVGYIACLLHPEQEMYGLAPCGDIDLIAVSPDGRGKGIGLSLVLAALAWFRERVGRVIVKTQVTNIPAINLYQKVGFHLEQAHISLHWNL